METEKRVQALKKRTMTLSELQLRTLDVLRKVRFQFNRQAYQDGMSDTEFLDSIVSPFEIEIYQDRQVLKEKRKQS